MKSLFALSMASPKMKSLSFSAPFPDSSLSSLSFPKKSHFPICCSMSHDERLLARKKDQANRFYDQKKFYLLSSEEQKKLATNWINKNRVVADKDKYKKVKNKVMKKKKPEDLEEIEFGDVLEKGKDELITFMLRKINVLPVEEEKTEDKEEEMKKQREREEYEEEKAKKDEEEKLKKKLEEIEKLKKKLEDEEKMRKAKEEEEEMKKQRKDEEYENFFEEEKAKKEAEKEAEKKAKEDLLCAALVLGALMKHWL